MTLLKKLSVTIVAMCVVVLCYAQPGSNPGDPDGDPDVVPITGLEYLLIGGGAYGIARLVRRKKENDPGL